MKKVDARDLELIDFGAFISGKPKKEVAKTLTHWKAVAFTDPSNKLAYREHLKLPVDLVMGVVCSDMGIKKEEILINTSGAKTTDRIAYAKHIINYFLVNFAGYSHKAASSALNRKEHSSSIFSCRRVEEYLSVDETFQVDYKRLKQLLFKRIRKYLNTGI